MARPRQRFAITVSVQRDGLIRVLRQNARGGMAVFRFTDWKAGLTASRIIHAQARHARNGRGLLVPGVPEAGNDDEALDALTSWTERLNAIFARALPAGQWAYLGGAAA